MTSKEFIEFIFPCKDCLVAAACKEKKTISNKDLFDMHGVRCLALPSFDKQSNNSYQKSAIECIANLVWRFACKLNEDRNMKIPSQYRHFLIEYLGVFQYIINSTSWSENINPVADFDKDEIRQKLSLLSGRLDWKE